MSHVTLPVSKILFFNDETSLSVVIKNIYQLLFETGMSPQGPQAKDLVLNLVPSGGAETYGKNPTEKPRSSGTSLQRIPSFLTLSRQPWSEKASSTTSPAMMEDILQAYKPQN